MSIIVLFLCLINIIAYLLFLKYVLFEMGLGWFLFLFIIPVLGPILSWQYFANPVGAILVGFICPLANLWAYIKHWDDLKGLFLVQVGCVLGLLIVGVVAS